MKRLLTTLAATLLTWSALQAQTSDLAGYLFAYFQGNGTSQEHLFYAISSDGLNYTPLNGGTAVVDFTSIAVKKNIRDPFITRAEDGTWLMVSTDMRSSEGWSSNRGIVMSKSADLVNWTHSTVNFPTKYAGTTFANVTRVWAPEVIYDRLARRYMVYFSILTSDGTYSYDKVVYCPIQCVTRIDGLSYVYVQDGSGWAPRKVETGLDNNRMIRIVSGLKAGETIMLAPPVKEDKAEAADTDDARTEARPKAAQNGKKDGASGGNGGR